MDDKTFYLDKPLWVLFVMLFDGPKSTVTDFMWQIFVIF